MSNLTTIINSTDVTEIIKTDATFVLVFMGVVIGGGLLAIRICDPELCGVRKNPKFKKSNHKKKLSSEEVAEIDEECDRINRM